MNIEKGDYVGAWTIEKEPQLWTGYVQGKELHYSSNEYYRISFDTPQPDGIGLWFADAQYLFHIYRQLEIFS